MMYNEYWSILHAGAAPGDLLHVRLADIGLGFLEDGLYVNASIAARRAPPRSTRAFPAGDVGRLDLRQRQYRRGACHRHGHGAEGRCRASAAHARIGAPFDRRSQEDGLARRRGLRPQHRCRRRRARRRRARAQGGRGLDPRDLARRQSGGISRAVGRDAAVPHCRGRLALVLPLRPDRHRGVRLRRLHAGAAAALRPLGRADPHAIAGGRRRHAARSPHRRRPASTVHLQGSDVCLCRSGHRHRRHADVALAHAANHRLAQFRAGAGDLRHESGWRPSR